MNFEIKVIFQTYTRFCNRIMGAIKGTQNYMKVTKGLKFSIEFDKALASNHMPKANVDCMASVMKHN